MTSRLIFALRNRTKPIKVADEPFAVVNFPVERRMPVFTVHCFPSFRKPPTKVLVSTVSNESQELRVTHRRSVNRKIFYEDLMLRLFIIKPERLGVRCPRTALVQHV